MHVYDMCSKVCILDLSGKGYGMEGYKTWEELTLAAMWRCISMLDKDAALLLIDQMSEQTKNRIIETFGNDVREVVFDALQNAEQNGFTPDVAFRTVDSIINDLKMHCAELEGVTDEDILPHVEEWLVMNGYTLAGGELEGGEQ